nr:hypothetical protein BaRGS_021899 [Batillaria attramentaria]
MLMMLFVMLVLNLWYRPSYCGDVTSNRARRSDDRDPLEAVVMQQSAELNQVKAELAALQSKVAPYAGVYIIAFQFFTDGEERPLVDIVVNGNTLVRMALDTRDVEAHDESASTSIVVMLQAQDKVWVEAPDNNNARVSFLAQIASDRGTTFAGNGPYKFDQVLLNDGDAYDPMLGVFTAPYSGVYVFAAQVFTDRAERPLVDIRVNDKPLARMAINSKNLHDGEDEDSISTTVTVQLEDQDRVWLQSSVGDSFTYWGDHHTFFTGFLLYKAA